MAKELNMVISKSCAECPYCHNDGETGVSYCQHKDLKGDGFVTDGCLFPPILKNCPLPNKEGGVGA